MKTHFADDGTRIAELERDAARYRWLCSQQPAGGFGYKERQEECVITFTWPKPILKMPSLDAAIDAAIAAERGKG